VSFDAESHLGAVERSVSALERDGKPARAVTLARTYDTTIDDLWDAVTNRERLPRWFVSVSGDLKLGGRYQFEGNAGGEITACEPPSHVAVTWEFAGDVSWVEVRLSSEGDGRTRLTLTHTALLSDHWKQYGAGATGIGWELGVMALALHLARPDDPKMDEESFGASPEGKQLVRGSSEGWGQAAIASGEDAEAATAAMKRTTAFYTGEPAEA
jgi:uncharacterized protein YndB with AHSA1/START domain